MQVPDSLTCSVTLCECYTSGGLDFSMRTRRRLRQLRGSQFGLCIKMSYGGMEVLKVQILGPVFMNTDTASLRLCDTLVKRRGSGVRQSQARVPTLLLTSCVSLGKGLHFSELLICATKMVIVRD